MGARSDMTILIVPRHNAPSAIKHSISPRVAAINRLVEELFGVLLFCGVIDLDPR
jgi:hypothetical protein